MSRGAEKQYTEEEAIEWIDAFVAEFGVVPVSDDARGWPGPSRTVYRDRFGSWENAIREAGYEPRAQR